MTEHKTDATFILLLEALQRTAKGEHVVFIAKTRFGVGVLCDRAAAIAGEHAKRVSEDSLTFESGGRVDFKGPKFDNAAFRASKIHMMYDSGVMR